MTAERIAYAIVVGTLRTREGTHNKTNGTLSNSTNSVDATNTVGIDID